MNRELTFAKAIHEATFQLMERYSEVYVMGEGVDDYKGVWGTTLGLIEKFGAERVIDIPLSENAMTGIALGSSLLGFKPIFVHQRIDFMLMCMDAIFNQGAKWNYMTGFNQNMNIVIRAVIGRGWGQSVQHAQSFYPIFAHFPGVKVVAPFTPQEAKGLLISAVNEKEPVIIIEAKNLYESTGEVSDEFKGIDLGKANVIKNGNDITIAGLSSSLKDIMDAMPDIENKGISAEIINILSIKPLDIETIIESVKKTKNLIVVDITWEHFNVTTEISSIVSEKLFGILQRPPLRIALPDSYVGMSEELEKRYYLNKAELIAKIMEWHK